MATARVEAVVQQPLRVLTLDELRTTNLPPPEPIVEGLLFAGETILLVGRPKVGKSRLVQQLCLCLSRQEPFLGHPVPRPRRVLLVDLENRAAGAKSRFDHMAHPDKADSNVYIYAPDTLVESGLIGASDAGMANLSGLVRRTKSDVVIIDTWRLFMGGEENKPESVIRALKELSKLRRSISSRLAIVLVHHLRKERFESPVRLREDPFTWVESVSGHHALVGHVDACYGLEREVNRESEELIVFGGVARNAIPRCLLLEEDDQSLRFEVRSGEEAARQVMTSAERKLWSCAKPLGQFTFTQLVQESHSSNRKAVSSMLRKAESHGAIQRRGNLYVVVGRN